jgi:hypothetical protein
MNAANKVPMKKRVMRYEEATHPVGHVFNVPFTPRATAERMARGSERHRRILPGLRSCYNATMSTSSDPIVIYPSKLKSLGLLVWCLGFVVICIVMLARANVEGWLLVTSYLGLGLVILLSLVGAGVALARLILKKPLVTINHDGIQFLEVTLAWDEIHELIRHGPFPRTMLGIMPKNMDAFLARLPPGTERRLRWHLRMHPAPVNIPQFLLPMTVDQLIDLIQARFRPGIPIRRMS